MCKSVLCLSACIAVVLNSLSLGAERPTFNHGTADPRPDILPYWLHGCCPEYRRTYNRPRYVPGWLAHIVAPSSQEAMVWCEAKSLGHYRHHHMPPVYKQFYSPKPWELLETGPRPNTTHAVSGADSNPLHSTSDSLDSLMDRIETTDLGSISQRNSAIESSVEYESIDPIVTTVPANNDSAKVRMAVEPLPEQ